MREILFRGKCEYNGELVYGLLMIMWGKYHIIDLDDENTAYPIDPTTVGQYIGLTDKNGIKIFEGDICTADGEDGPFKIVWAKDRAMFRIESYCLSLDFDNFYPYEVEVIGNIHENPELMEG